MNEVNKLHAFRRPVVEGDPRYVLERGPREAWESRLGRKSGGVG